MKLSTDELLKLVVETVCRIAASGLVERRRVIDRVEEAVRERGLWEDTDDAWSESVDPKSIGRAKIDWAISSLKESGRLDNPARNRWGIPQRGAVERDGGPSDEELAALAARLPAAPSAIWDMLERAFTSRTELRKWKLSLLRQHNLLHA